MADRRLSLPSPHTTIEAEVATVDSFRLPDGSDVSYSIKRLEQLTMSHLSISQELMMVGLHQADAQKQVAIAKYAVPAQEQTSQIKLIAIAVSATVLIGVTGACFRPEAAASIASMVAVVGVVFGGIFAATKYLGQTGASDGES